MSQNMCYIIPIDYNLIIALLQKKSLSTLTMKLKMAFTVSNDHS